VNEVRTAERIIRRFARETNLLVAGRPAIVRRPAAPALGAVAEEVERMLRRLGARPGTPGAPGLVEYAFDRLEAHEDPESVPLLLDGAPLPARTDARARIAFAAQHMPVSAEIAAGLDLTDVRIGVAMVLEPKTAQLALLLRDAGANVAVYAHPDETDVEVAAALGALDVPVVADPDISGAEERQAALDFLARGFDVFIDDGSHLIRLAHEDAPELVDSWWGANEETTSGLTPLRLMHEKRMLRTGVMAVNDAQTKTRFDNRYGTGQSCVFAIADLLDTAGITVRDQPALVIGYGPVGEGVAAHLTALGAEVRVAETDPVRALVALHDGFEVGPAAALAEGALVVSATGVRHTVTAEILSLAKAVAVAGGVPGEVDLAPDARFEPVHTADPRVEALQPSGTLVLDRGGCINITAAEGNPIEIMDLSFAVQLAAVAHVVAKRPGIGIHALPPEVDDRVARAALAVRGVASELAPSEAPDEEASARPTTEWRSTRYLRGSDQ
jgi:adenosylhomocysteinase